MKKFFAVVLTFRFIVGFFALLALLLIWLAGNELGLPTRDARFLASLAVLSAWVLILLIGHWLGRTMKQSWRGWAEQRQQEALAKPAAAEDTHHSALRSRLLAAIHTLESSRLGRRWLPFGRRAVYGMPWVVVMGASGAGRTSLMTHSDLEFPLLEFSPYEENREAGYDGCEWHFATQSVMLDTHGRLAETSEGRAEWRSLLTLLKKHRRKKPLDALVLAVDAASLAVASPEAIERLAKQVRDRVHDLADQIGFQVPIYIAFTQMDRVEGFEAFFRGANAKDLQKPWGAMLSWRKRAKVAAAQAFNQEFDLLASELREMAEQRLLQQRSVSERLGLYSFPIEFAKLKPALSAFVGRLFQTNPYQFRPLFRGFYFTSVTQGGELVSPAGTQIRNAYGIYDGGERQAAPAAQPRRYFVDEFFRTLVLPDRALALRLPWRLERWQKWVVGTSFASVLLVAGAMALSWNHNRTALQTVSGHLADLQASLRTSQNPRDWLPRLDAIRADAEALDAHASARPWWWRFGLYHGDAARESAREAFFGQFQQEMLNPMGQWLEHRLSLLDLPRRAAAPSTAAASEGGSNDAVEEGYALFKVYSGMSEPARAEEALMTKRLPEIWPKSVAERLGPAKTLAADEQRALERCIGYYVSQLKAGDVARYSAHEAVLGGARDALKNLVTEVSPVRRLYKSIQGQAAHFPGITLAGLLGESSGLLRGGAQIDGMYTQQAWKKFFEPAFEEASKKQLVSDNMLGEPARAASSAAGGRAGVSTGQAPIDQMPTSQEQTFEELKGYYIEDYAQQWRQFLGGIEVVPFASLDAAVASLGRLGDQRSSPYVTLMQTLDEQTAWDAPTRPIFEEIAGQAQSLKDKVLGKEPDKQRVQKGEQVIGRGRLEAMFTPLAGLVRSADKAGAATQTNQSLARYLEQLQAVRNRLAKIRAGSAQGGAAVALVKNTLDGAGSEINDAYVWTDQLLAGMDYKTRDAVSKLFMQPILGAWDTVLTPAAIEINGAWQSTVLEPWTQAFAGRYPFVDSTVDSSLLELTKFVRDKDGLVWSFMRQNFDFLVTRQGNQIVPRTWAGKGLNVRPDFLETMNRLARVGEAIALKGEVGFRFYLQPEANAEVAQTELEVDGQTLKYQNGPQDWKLMTWPGASTAPQMRVQAVVQDASHESGAVQVAQYQRGTWAFMRALAAAQVERLDGSRARVSWKTANGQTVSYLMRNEASYGPQDLALIYGITLPSQILQAQLAASNATAPAPVPTPVPTPAPSPLPPPLPSSPIKPAPKAAPGASPVKTPVEREALASARQLALRQINAALPQPDPADGSTR